MFERYTEKARRVIFFARYEASHYGSPYIETQHLLLGLMREDKALANRFLRQQGSIESIRKEIEARITIRERIPTSAEVPLADECKKILHFATEESDRLGHRHVGTEHLLLAMLRMEGSLAGQILLAKGLKAAEIKEQLAKTPHAANVRTRPEEATSELVARLQRRRGLASGKLEDFLSGLRDYATCPDKLKPFFAKDAQFVDVHGKRWNPEEIDKEFETLFAPYAKKNTAYTIEETIQDTKDVVVTVVLWKNAILASMERVWMHRMSIVLVPEGEDWAIALIQVTPVKPA